MLPPNVIAHQTGDGRDFLSLPSLLVEPQPIVVERLNEPSIIVGGLSTTLSLGGAEMEEFATDNPS